MENINENNIRRSYKYQIIEELNVLQYKTVTPNNQGLVKEI